MASIKKSGFTLVELLTAVSIVGILAAIAVPSYVNQRQARQSEAKVSLGALYMSENTMMQDQHSYSGCFSGITGGPPSGIDYYSVGFGTGVVGPPASANAGCYPYGVAGSADTHSVPTSLNCAAYGWSNVPAGSTVLGGGVATCSTAYYYTYTQICGGQGNGFTYYVGKEVGAPTDVGGLPGTSLTWSSFTISASAQLGGSRADQWQIDQDKVVSLTQSGL